MSERNALGRREFVEEAAGSSCDVDKNHLQNAINRVDSQYKNKDCAAYADNSELLARIIRFNPQTEEILDDQAATSLLGNSVCSPWHL